MSINPLDTASVGRPVTRQGTSLFPVYLPGNRIEVVSGPQAGLVITEKDGGVVPELVASNTGPVAALLVDGETVVGGRQNRILNVTVLIPAGGTVTIPVSCIEQGRWNSGTTFRHGRSMASRRVRRATTESTGRNVQRGGERRSDQGQVWDSVASELQRLEMQNPSMSFDVDAEALALDTARRSATDELIALGPLPGQCGVVVAHGRRIVACDVFGHPDVLAGNWEALVRSYLLDAPGTVRSTPSATKALTFLHRLASAPSVVHAGVGVGEEHHVRSRSLVGQALTLDGLVVHASAFAVAA